MKTDLPKIKDLIASLKPQGLPSREELLVKLAPPQPASKRLPDRHSLLRLIVTAQNESKPK